MIEQAVQRLHDSHAAGQDLILSINVSGRTMGDPGLGDHLADLLVPSVDSPRSADRRDHRDRRDQGDRLRPGSGGAASRARVQAGDRRLRRRVRVLLLPQAPPLRLSEDRRRVHPRPLRHADRPARRRRDRHARPGAGNPDDRRVRRRRRDRLPAAGARRRLRPGVPRRSAESARRAASLPDRGPGGRRAAARGAEGSAARRIVGAVRVPEPANVVRRIVGDTRRASG